MATQRNAKCLTKAPSTNSVILTSIPLNREMKRYWLSKYERIACNCGVDEAIRKFKNLRVQVLRYIADSNRKANLNTYLSSTGFRTNGYLRMLFEYALTQPHYVLNFLKLYSAEQRATKSPDAAAGETKRRLDTVKANEAIPRFLISWLDCLGSPHGASYKEAGRDPGHPMHRLAVRLSYDEWHQYWLKWYRVLRSGWQSSSSLDYKPVFPEIYKDYASDSQYSASYLADVADLISMHMTGDDSPLSMDQLEFVDGYLNDEVGDALHAVLWGEMPQLDGLFLETSILSGLYVGHVQHIHKKGGGTDLRDIAVPNRFIQNALVPAAGRLYDVVRRLPQDATFDQDKFDTKIQNRVNNDNLYQGSVDLSKATDNLPFSWGDKIIQSLGVIFAPNDDQLLSSIFGASSPSKIYDVSKDAEFWDSYELFRTIARANWEDEGYFIRWKVGQPLGSLPSFAMLAITHNLLLESLCASLGFTHSPYVVLGDDVVIFNRKVRARYITQLASRGVPLSLHKSYEGRLSEFAGKTYVKGSVPFYCSDHNPVTWNSLLDWQRTTGIRIPYENLPRATRRKIESIAKQRSGEHPSPKAVKKLANSAYNLVLTCEVRGRGSVQYPISDSTEMSDLIACYFENRITDSPVPDPVKHTGITIIGNGHPVVLMDSRFADKDGYFMRFRPVELPAWYRAKVRPCATDAAISAAIEAVNSDKEIYQWIRTRLMTAQKTL